MKTVALFCIRFLLINGVLADAGEVTSVSVIEEGSFTLHNNIELESKSVIEWDFRGKTIARIDREANSVSVFVDVYDGIFRDRLQLDNQTGYLTITNITTNHSGEYQLDVTNKKRNQKTFSVYVVDAGEVKSVMEGDYATLHVGNPDFENYDVIRWRFRQTSLLAEIDRKAELFSTHEDVQAGRFKDRLQLDHGSGDLTIKNIISDLSGLYEVNFISKSGTHTINQTYTLTVSGEVKILSVIEGDSVTLLTNLTGIQPKHLILWMFMYDDTLIAEMNQSKNIFTTYNGTDERFRDRLNLNHQTGSVIIYRTKTKLSGLYQLLFISRRQSIRRRITVIVTEALFSPGLIAVICVCVLVIAAAAAAPAAAVGGIFCRYRFPKARKLEVMKRNQVILHSDVAVRRDDDVIEWRFGSQKIAEMGPAINTTHGDALDGKFRGRLTLRGTGSLTITDTRTTDSGVYQLIIISNGKTSYKRFRLNVTSTLQHRFGNEGYPVLLKTNIEIRNKQIEWIFKVDTVIARINPALNICSTFDGDDGLFRDTLQLNPDTGDLTINNIRQEHSGDYKLKIIDGEITSYRRFKVSLNDSNIESEPLMNGGVQQQ